MLQHSYSLLLFYWTHSSTPKSTRQGLSSTPAPLASPVLSVDGATPHSVPLLHEKDIPKVVTKVDNSGAVVAADSGKVCSHVIFFLISIDHQTVVVMYFYSIRKSKQSFLIILWTLLPRSVLNNSIRSRKLYFGRINCNNLSKERILFTLSY